MSFSALFESPTKDIAQKYGSTVKNLTLAFSPKLSGGVPIHVWKPGKILGHKVNFNFFTLDPYFWAMSFVGLSKSAENDIYC